MRDKRARDKAMLERKSEHIETKAEGAEEETREAIRQKYVREMQLDESYAQFPSPLRREWSIA